MTWMLVLVRLAGEPSRYRVAVWRELRRVGAVPVTQGTWLMPATPWFVAAERKVRELAERGSGEVITVEVTDQDGDTSALAAAFAAARVAEWAEFSADCGKFEAEIAKEIRIEKFTLAELDEEEQSLDRLRRWYRELKLRDVQNLPESATAEQRLKECTEVFDDYADRVYRAMHDRAD
jgi:ChrB-like protein